MNNFSPRHLLGEGAVCPKTGKITYYAGRTAVYTGELEHKEVEEKD